MMQASGKSWATRPTRSPAPSCTASKKCWHAGRAITAPVLWVEAEQTNMWDWMGPKAQARAEVDRRLSHLKNVRSEMLADAGHMLHHDQPEQLARLIEAFL